MNLTQRARNAELPVKVSNKVLKQAIGPCHPLFWGPNSQEGTQQQTQVKAGRGDLIPFREILCSLEGGSAQSAFVKECSKLRSRCMPRLRKSALPDGLLTAQAAR